MASWRDDLVLGGGVGLGFWILVISFEENFIREEILSRFSPWRGFALAWSLYVVSVIFIIFLLIVV